jgi:DNA-binding phage protein
VFLKSQQQRDAAIRIDPAPLPTERSAYHESIDAKALEFKKAIAVGLLDGMKRRKITISQLARETGAGRESIRRVLNPRDPAITLKTIARTADVLGLRLAFVPDDTSNFMREAAGQMGAMLDAEASKAHFG